MTDFSSLEAELESPAEYLRLARYWASEKFLLTTRCNLALAELASATQNEEAFRLLAAIAERE